ncbi:hypothetical protein APW96_09940 [Staphylococcus aureus]|nr:hypothetical protein APW96_09940 [Staphylococcus aureus]
MTSIFQINNTSSSIQLERTIENNGYEADLNVRMTYYHNVSRKQQEVILKGQIDRFNTYNNKEIYDLQFI